MHYNHLIREHRYAIYLGSEEGERHEAIARQINVHPSSICVKTCCKSIFFLCCSWRMVQENADICKECMLENKSIAPISLRRHCLF